MKFRVSETFTSIQGEGIWAGVPSFFIRLSGCNLRCAWCDTPYASWEPEGVMVSVEQLAQMPDVRHVVITGGEPMLFEGVEELCRLLKGCTPCGSPGVPPLAESHRGQPPSPRTSGLPPFKEEERGGQPPHPSPLPLGSGGEGATATDPEGITACSLGSQTPGKGTSYSDPEGVAAGSSQPPGAAIITIETAGTRFLDLPCDLMSISPKLRNSTPTGGIYTGPARVKSISPEWEHRHDRERLNIPVLSRLIETYDHQLKFVVASPNDLPEIEGLLAQLPPVQPDRIILMPEGVTSEKLHQAAKSLVPICLAKGWRLGPRLHIDLFGDTKGT